MTDTRDMLERAARACGYNVTPHPNARVFSDCIFILGDKNWNPLTSNDDCAAMCARLGISTHWIYKTLQCITPIAVECVITQASNRPRWMPQCMARLDEHNNDPEAAWRYAATVVAGMMGEAMP